MEETFIAAILEATDAAELRLIYADWLEEHGDPRAEYIRLLSSFDQTPQDAPLAAELLAGLHRLQLQHQIDRRWVLLLCRERILRLLRALQAGEARQEWPTAGWLRELACRFDALPIYADMGGTILLRPDGELLGVYDDGVPSVLEHRGWRTIGLVSGAEFFPELRPLLPPRPNNAFDCHPCGGRGVERWWMEGRKGVTSCSSCWGLGWIPQRPANGSDCASCRGTGRQTLGNESNSFETPCSACFGRGWEPRES